MREISSAYVGETGNGVKPTPQPLQHEFMNSHLFCRPTQQLTLISVVKFSVALGPQGKICPISRISASWLIHADGHSLPHQCHLQHLFECYTF